MTFPEITPRAKRCGMQKLVQAKHVPEADLLQAVDDRDQPLEPNSFERLALRFPKKVILVRVRKLIRRGLIAWDRHAPLDLRFWLTNAGISRLKELRTALGEKPCR